MPVNIERREILKKKEIHESTNEDYTFGAFTEQSESEIKWVELHQMFDR